MSAIAKITPIVPRRLVELLNHADKRRVTQAMPAMLTMRKIDIAALEQAFAHG